MSVSLRETEDKIRSAFYKQYETDHPKEEKDDEEKGMSNPMVCCKGCYLKDIYSDYVLFEDEGKLYKLLYTGGFEKPNFGDTTKAVRVELQPVEVSEEKAAEDEAEIKKKLQKKAQF